MDSPWAQVSQNEIKKKKQNLNGSAMPPTPIRSFVRSLACWRARRENFSSTRKFRRDENLGKESLGRCDCFRQKIVKIGAILAIFRLFEDFARSPRS